MPRAKRATKKQTAKEKREEQIEEKEQEQEDKFPQKTKQIVKAKKYKQKSFDQLMRINKSKHERIFLIEAKRNEDQYWAFTVQGTKGSHYNVRVSTEVKCSCMDFKLKKKPCKHIYFIVTQVGQNDELLDYFRDKKTISKNAYKLLDSQLFSRLKSRMDSEAKDAKDIDLKDDTNCVICFSQMDKETESLEDCGTCKKYFHTQCIAAWKNHNPTCPLCRGPLAGGGRDPLGLLKGIEV